jgi:hypothetical protein
MYGSEMEFDTLNQKNAGLDTAKLHRNPVDDRVQEFIELKDRTNLLRGLLNRKQNI